MQQVESNQRKLSNSTPWQPTVTKKKKQHIKLCGELYTHYLKFATYSAHFLIVTRSDQFNTSRTSSSELAICELLLIIYCFSYKQANLIVAERGNVIAVINGDN